MDIVNSNASHIIGMGELLNKSKLNPSIKLFDAECEITAEEVEKEKSNILKQLNLNIDSDDSDTSSISSRLSDVSNSSKKSNNSLISNSSVKHKKSKNNKSGDNAMGKFRDNFRDNYERRKYNNEYNHNIDDADFAINNLRNSRINKTDNNILVNEEKSRIIEQIKSITKEMESNGIHCEKYELSINMQAQELESILRALLNKHDSDRATDFFSEVAAGAAGLVEEIFDGSRKIPLLNIRPNYTGYTHTLQDKLLRMKYDISGVVNGGIKQLNISPLTRIGLELLPSFLMYPKMNSMYNNNDIRTQLIEIDRYNNNMELDKI